MGADSRRRGGDDGSERFPEDSARLDLRLIVPACTAWAALAVLLPGGGTALAAGSIMAALVAGGAWHVRERRRASSTALVATLSCVILAGAALQIALREAGPVPELAQERALVTVEGRVGSDPRLLRAGPERRVDMVLVRLDVDEVVGRGNRSAVSTPVLVWATKEWGQVRWNERVRASGRLATAPAGEDVVARFTPIGSPHVVAGAGAVSAGAEHVRSRLRAAVEPLPKDARGLLPGLIIGDTSLAPTELTDDMRATSLTHLSAVSGSNVAIVLAAAVGVARAAHLPRRWRPVWAGVALLGFVMLARPEPSVLRAAVMGAVGLVGISASRRAAGPPALGAAVSILLLADPWLARSYGFALSTLATIGLLVFARPWGEWFGRFLPRRLRGIGPALAIPVAAQVLCAPVIVLLTSSVSIVGVFANLLVAPLVAPATILGVVAALLAAVSVTLGTWAAALGAIPALGIAQVAHWCAGVPFGTMPWPGGIGGGLLLAGVSVAVLLTGPWLLAQAVRRPLAAVATTSLALACVVPPPGGSWPDPGWRFVLCDVGQGDGMVLRTGPSSAVVVDAGPTPTLIAGCLDRLGVESVDAMVLTHMHADHVAGLEGVLARWPVREVFTAAVDDPPEDARRVAASLSARGLAVQRVHRGDVLRWGSVVARVRWPEGRLASGSVPNNNSVVLDVDADGLRLFLMADVEREAAAAIRAELARDGDSGPVDVLKVAHHGSANHDRDLIVRLHPRMALISLGADNTFGHPAPSLLSTLALVGAPVFRTDRDGDLLVSLVDGVPALARSR